MPKLGDWKYEKEVHERRWFIAMGGLALTETRQEFFILNFAMLYFTKEFYDKHIIIYIIWVGNYLHWIFLENEIRI